MRLIAVALGMLSALCALAFPFLPVVQDTAEVVWPTGSDTRSVNAPLTGYWAQDLRAHLPCATIRSLDARTNAPALLFATVPDGRTDPKAGKGVGLQLRIDNGVLLASSQGQQIAQQPLPPDNCDVDLKSDAAQMTLTVAQTTVFHADGDVRPRVVGIYSSINGQKDPISGLHVSVVPDTRYQTSPTTLKIVVGIVAVLAFIGCLITTWRRDSGFARRAPRWAPVGWWRLTLRDTTVIAALGAWVFIGPVTSDDGYILSMARVTEDAGFLTNYHRWFGVAEAPFGWFYHVYELMAHVSVVPPWIRLPSFLLGVLSWLFISREVMPRLGTQVRNSRPAGWAAAAVFLVWWMPYNNGTRPEPVAALGSLLAICAVERTLVTRRLLPLCLGLTAAGFTLAATPTGLIAVAPFLVAARPLFKIVRQRANESGWLPVLAPVLASGLLVLVVVFADQTFATVQEATRIRTQVGPNLSWFQELQRYQLLFENLPDGSAPRRFPVLLILLCASTCLVVLLRRGRIPGAALGPSRRLIGTVALFFLLLALTPTKWTHHFGAFAAVGASMAALTALATSSTVLRSRRNRAAFLAGLLVVAALAATGPNTYWFVSRLGVQWTNVSPSVGGIPLSTILLVAAAIAGIYAFVENVRAHRPGLPVVQEGRSRSLRLGSVSLVVVCGLVATGEFVTMAWAMHNQAGSYSLGAANIGHLFGKSCNLSDHVMVERDAATSILHVQPEQRTVPDSTQPPDNSPLPNPDKDNGRIQLGFHTRPMDDKDPLAEPPHGFTPDKVPMWSSYLDPGTRAGRLRSEWYALPEKPADGQIVIATAAVPRRPTSVSLDYGVITPEGVKILRSQFALPPGAGTYGWSDTRINLRDLPPQTNAVRVNIVDNDLTEDGWIAAS
ncbi:MAG TPA: arabinosyltransferase domain-containing protein, partial [Amycolatopsis sp.]|nr:arabinosyltransferase domain-containing protein [Amycolatopsis sp.]